MIIGANPLLLNGNNNLIQPIHLWEFDDGGGGPYVDTGSVGGQDMSVIGTVADDTTFGGVSFSGAGAVAAPDTSSVWDNIFSGTGKKFSLKINVEFDNFSSDSYVFSRINTAAGERSFIFIVRSGGTNIDFIWYSSNAGTSVKGLRKSVSLSAATEYIMAVTFDEDIDTNNALDRCLLFIDGTESGFDSILVDSGSPTFIVATDARLSVGAGVSGAGSRQSTGSMSGNVRRFAVYDEIITSAEASV